MGFTRAEMTAEEKKSMRLEFTLPILSTRNMDAHSHTLTHHMYTISQHPGFKNQQCPSYRQYETKLTPM